MFFEEEFLRTALWTIGGVVVFLIILMLLIRWVIRSFKRWVASRSHELDRDEMRARWGRIENTPDQLALIEADKLLDYVLKAMHMPGETFALRIQFAQKKFYELKRVRWAHNLRNKVVHEPEFHLPRRQAYAALKEYERALKLLGAL